MAKLRTAPVKPMPMQALLFVRDGWVPILTGRAAAARAVRPHLAQLEAAKRALDAAIARLVEFHHEHCPEDVPFADCDVCRGRC